MAAKLDTITLRTNSKPTANTRLAQWGLTQFIETLCFYCKFVLVDNLVFQNPPLRQAWERYAQQNSLSSVTHFRVSFLLVDR